MKFKELPNEVQEHLNSELCKLQDKNTVTEMFFYNKLKKRYFMAYRHTLASKYGRFGGGSYWSIKYGEIGFKKNVIMGVEDYSLAYGRFGKSANGTVIPKTLGKKQEVIELVKSIGIFNV